MNRITKNIPLGGNPGDVLTKASHLNYDVKWEPQQHTGGNGESGSDIPDTSPIPTESSIPKGLIASWYGQKENIPSGWSLCDGTNGTPDLRDRFLLGAGESHSVGETGGEEEVTLTIAQMPNHTHQTTEPTTQVAFASATSTSASKAYTTTRSTNVNYSGNSKAHNNMPPYYTLFYIMKI